MVDVGQIETRGRLTPEYDLSGMTWLRVGGPADWLFLPKDVDDLSNFLKALADDVAVFPMGVGSNLIVRDGGIRGVVGPRDAGQRAVEHGDQDTEDGEGHDHLDEGEAAQPACLHVRTDIQFVFVQLQTAGNPSPSC